MTAINSEKLGALYPAHLRTVRERTDQALAEAGFDAIVIAAGDLRMQFLDDNAYPFKVNPHFKWWVPIVTNPNCFVIYEPGKKPSLVYYQPVDYWYKPAGTPQGFWVDQFDIKVIGDAGDAKQHFPAGRVAVIAEDDGIVQGSVRNPEPLMLRLHYERSWKTDYEIECMRQANVRGARGHRAAEKAFRAGESEYEIHLAYLRASDQTEEEIPYSNIIAINENASVLHYTLHERERIDVTRRHSFLIDAGAAVNGYASDITRTYSRESDEFAQLIAAMDDMQQGLVAEVAPDVNYPDVHMSAHRGVAEIVVRFDFVRGLDAAGVVEKRISSTFLPHGVGHFLGLQVHDVAGFAANAHGATLAKPEGHPYLRLTRRVEPRMCFTIEPGLYFIEPLLSELQKSENAKYVNWQKVDAFRKFGGIRIEDDVVVTESGRENLTRAAFADVS
ncbi:MAG TPA: Xaa-Pro dipeptidase [Thermoanaerobaculia bacterium]|nr:Xaa-Pro dipeptidase [Thermoanaerobaculia bacterium]